MNFIEEFKAGQSGKNKGIPLGPGLDNISKAINGIQKDKIFVLGAMPKVGKTTFADYGFLIQPYLYCVEHNIPIEWIYFSFEIDRVSKEFDVATYFLFHDYGIEEILLPEGITKDGLSSIPLSPNYLKGSILDDNNNIIKVDDAIVEKLKIVYSERIVPMFGEYDKYGNQIKKGYITFVGNSDNPTGLRNFILHFAEERGQLLYENFNNNKRISGYIPNNPEKYTIIITDHVRKMRTELNYSMKQNIDKYLEYTTELRKWCKYTFVHIVHLNRDLGSISRLQEFGDLLYPTDENSKDSGNFAEECSYFFTMFNPNDMRYNLKKHFGLIIKDSNGNDLYPHMRTIHLVQSRHCEFPQHFRVNMQGNIKNFSQTNNT